MNSKTKALALLSVIVAATVVGAIVISMQTASADSTDNAVASDIESTPSPQAIDSYYNGSIGFGGGFFHGSMMGMEGRFSGHRGLGQGFGGFGAGAIQVSSDFTTNVTNIAKADSDVQNLLSQGFNITSIRPVITTTVDGNGNIVTKASTANVLLEGNNGSRALVSVDLSQAKVTKIVTLTVTEIDK